MYYILLPFSALLKLLYTLFNNYALALIGFALIVKLILLPFNIKGKRSMIQMNLLNGKMQQLQKQYGKDKQRYQMEVQKLYEKEKVNPASGCIWSLIPMIVLFALYYVIREPLTYMMHMSTDLVQLVANTVGIAQDGAYYQLSIAQALTDNSLFETVKSAISSSEFADTYNLSNLFQMSYNSFGVDLSTVPQWKFWEYGSFTWDYIGKFLIPVFSAVTGLLSSLISMKTNKLNNQTPSGNTQTDMMQKQMIIMMPLMSLLFAFWMPAGLGVYWIANNILMILQELLCGRILKKDYERAAIAREEQERLEKEETRRRREEKIAERERQAAEAKEARKKGITVAKENKPQPQQEKDRKKKESTTEAGRIGRRAYARGRSYEEGRYPVTPYFDPDGTTAAAAEKPEEAPEKPEPAAKEAPAETVTEVSAEAPAETADAPETPAGENGGQ